MSVKIRVVDVMTGIVETAREDETLLEVAERMADADVGAIPVCDAKGKLKGIVTDRDIVVRGIAAGRDPKTTPVSAIETGEVRFVSPDDPVEAAAKLMASDRLRRVPVVRGEELVGLVGHADLARALRPERIGAVLLEVLKS